MAQLYSGDICMARKKKETEKKEPFKKKVVFASEINSSRRPKKFGTFKCCR